MRGVCNVHDNHVGDGTPIHTMTYRIVDESEISVFDREAVQFWCSPWDPAQVRELNRRAAIVMATAGVPTVDLHAAVVAKCGAVQCVRCVGCEPWSASAVVHEATSTIPWTTSLPPPPPHVHKHAFRYESSDRLCCAHD